MPRAQSQVQQALGTSSIPTSTQDVKRAAKHTTGIRHKLLLSLQHRLERLGVGAEPAIDVTLKVFEGFIGIFFTFAAAAYWIFERDRAIALVLSLLPRRHRGSSATRGT